MSYWEWARLWHWKLTQQQQHCCCGQLLTGSHWAQSTPSTPQLSSPVFYRNWKPEERVSTMYYKLQSKTGAEISKCLEPYFSLYLSIYNMRSTCKRILHLFNYLKANKYNGTCPCNLNLSDLSIGMTHFNTTTLPSRPFLRQH